MLNGKGIWIVFLISLIALLGCQDITSSLPGSDLELNGEKTDNPAGAAALAAKLNANGNFVTAAGSTVAVNDNTHLQVVEFIPPAAAARAAGESEEDPGQIASFILEPGVIFSVPGTASVTVVSGSIVVRAETDTVKPAEIQAAGSIVVDAADGIVAAGPVTLTGKGSLDLRESATIKVNSGGKLDVQSDTAQVKVPAGTRIVVGVGGTIEIRGTVETGGEIVVAEHAGVTVALGGKLEVEDGGSIQNSGIITAIGTVDVKSGGAVGIKSGGSLEVKSENALVVADSGGVLVESGAGITVDADIDTEAAGKITVEKGATISGGKIGGIAVLPFSLVSRTVSYGSGNTLSIAFKFSDALSDAPIPSVGWSLGLSTDKKTLSAFYTGSAKGPVSIGFTAVRNADLSETVEVSTSAYAVESAPFSRSSAGTYQVVYYGEVEDAATPTYVAGLKNGVERYYLVADPYFKDLFNGIYTPNAPGSTDSIESGKSTIAYDQSISDTVLGLFSVTVGGTKAADKVEIKGTALPNASGASAENLIVIDIGVPGTIPHRGLGTDGATYPHIRFRVNQGAELVILADNSSYIANGAENPTPTGYFNNGCVEVMAGGKLRDGAYEGFPLGSNAVILNHAGSYLSVGPEPTHGDATGAKAGAYQAYYAGYLIGPDGDPRIVWDSGNTGYLEVRPGALAISGNVTVKKLLGLIYDAYFIGNTTVTIADEGYLAPNDNGSEKYDFFGTSNQAKIVVQRGGTIGKGFLTAADADSAKFLTAPSGSVTIQNDGSGGASGTYTTLISGTQNWTGYSGLTEQ
jgi:hypothetical protein